MDQMHKMYEWTMKWSEHKFAVPILCLLSFVEASFFLIPPDVLLITMSAVKPRKALYYAFYTTLFSVLGALFGYWIGMTIWEHVQGYFFAYIFTPEQFEFVKSQFDENTFLAIVIAAFTPIPFKAFTVIGGILSAPLAPFILGAIVGRSGRYFMLSGLFFIFGEKIKEQIDKHFEKATLIIGALFVLIVAVYMYARN
jgi:membrane protein YqaA with SNARE-associated domain